MPPRVAGAALPVCAAELEAAGFSVIERCTGAVDLGATVVVAGAS